MGFFSSIASVVKDVGRAVDPTYSRGTIGRITAPVARPIVQSAAVAVTGGASLLVQSRAQRADALRGFAAGAAIGTAARAGGLLGGLTAGSRTISDAYAGSTRAANGIIEAGQVSNNPNPNAPGVTGGAVDPQSRSTIAIIALGGLAIVLALIWGK